MLWSEAAADSTPLRELIECHVDDALLAAVAQVHASGRRLYVGTTNIDTRRLVIWDMGAIAASGRPDAKDLYRKIILASASIPGFFPPVRISMRVDGKQYTERHIDGGTTSSMFFAPPLGPSARSGDADRTGVPIAEHEKLPTGWLYGSDVYVLVAGKMYPDPTPVKLFRTCTCMCWARGNWPGHQGNILAEIRTSKQIPVKTPESASFIL